VTLAGLKKLRAQGSAIRSGETVVLVLTGHTLKDADYTIDFHRGTLLKDEEKVGLEAEIDGLRRNAHGGGHAGAVLAAMKGKWDERRSRRVRCRTSWTEFHGLFACPPATSANLGPGFDAVAVALDFIWRSRPSRRGVFDCATGAMRSAAGGSKTTLILETYKICLRKNGRPVVPLAIRMENGIPLGMGCGSSAAGRLAAIALAVHFGGWAGAERSRRGVRCWRASGQCRGVLAGRVCGRSLRGQNRACGASDPPAEWRAIVVLPAEPLATSKARAVLPASYPREDVVANMQSVALLGLAFAQGRGDLLRLAMQDRIHQPYRAPICPLLPRCCRWWESTGFWERP
jgi:homoserine kinase